MLHVGNETMPVIKGLVVLRSELDDMGRPVVVVLIKKQQFHCGSILGVQAKVHAFWGYGSTQGVTFAR
jgi:hypothetical protein